MSWFTELFSKSKKKTQQSVVPSCEEENKPYTVKEYLGFYDIGTVFQNETFARKSLLTGEYMCIDDYFEKKSSFFFWTDTDECFEDFTQAYKAFCELDMNGKLDEKQFLMVCNSLLIMFNKQYKRPFLASRPDNFRNDYPRFFRVVRCMLSYNLHVLIKADLYRQISFFKKSVELLNKVRFDTDFERELCDEIRLRACNNIRYPFMICDVDELSAYSNDPNRSHELDWFFDVHYKITLRTPICRIARGGENWVMPNR